MCLFLCSCVPEGGVRERPRSAPWGPTAGAPRRGRRDVVSDGYSMTSVTTPEPTVRPPSRMAKRRPWSMAIGLDELDLHLDVVTGHHHLDAVGQLGHAGDVGGAEVELRAVAREERRVAAALLLLEDVDLGLELGVRRDRPRLAQHLTALDLLALGAAQQAADVVAGLAAVEDLAEHLDAGDDGARRLLDADDLDRVAGVDDPLLDTARRDGAAAGDREDVLDRHQERLVEVALGLRDVGVQLLGELDDLGRVLRVALERLERRAGDERDVVAREVVLVEQVADLDLDELEELVVVDHVGLVEEHDDVRHADLTGEQDVLTRLRHRAVGGARRRGSRRPSGRRR